MAENPLERFPLVHCETCKCDRPWQFVVIEAGKLNAKAYADMLCAHCKTIIATVSEAPSVPVSATDLV